MRTTESLVARRFITALGTVITVAAVSIGMLANAAPAAAHAQRHPEASLGDPSIDGWKMGDFVGQCGADGSQGIKGSSNYIKSLQAILWADGEYDRINGLGLSNVDGYWGPNTGTAVGYYQDKHGISRAPYPCAGYNTWYNMDKGAHELRLIDWCGGGMSGPTYTRFYWWDGVSSKWVWYEGEYVAGLISDTFVYWTDGWRQVDHPLTAGDPSRMPCW